MDTIRFQAELNGDQTIRLPDGATMPPGTVEVTVRKYPDPAAVGANAELVKRENYASVWEWLQAVGRQAETWDIDLPSDMAENHDYYAHGKPRVERPVIISAK